MIATASLVVAVMAGCYEVVVRLVPSIPIKYSWIQKILNLLQLISGAVNNTTGK
jgi:hypothetical protein